MRITPDQKIYSGGNRGIDHDLRCVDHLPPQPFGQVAAADPAAFCFDQHRPGWINTLQGLHQHAFKKPLAGLLPVRLSPQ